MTPEQFKSRRSDLGFTQAKIAKALGFSIRSISDFETGNRVIPKVVELALRALKAGK